MTLNVLLTPIEFSQLPGQDLSQTVCVVFDVLRATTSMITALAQGAEAIHPVETIEEALRLQRAHPESLLAGERHGLKIDRRLTGSVDFDFGNSPREFTSNKVRGRKIIATTTNGTRALKASQGAQRVLPAGFINLNAVHRHLVQQRPKNLLLICSGTGEAAAYEDILAAGALCHALQSECPITPETSDAVRMAIWLYTSAAHRLVEALEQSQNGSRLKRIPELAADVPICAALDTFSIVPELATDGWIRVPKSTSTSAS